MQQNVTKTAPSPICNQNKIREIAEYVDLFLFDFKESNPELHEVYTGADNSLIFENLYLLNELKKDIILRFPVIAGFNDRIDNYDKICFLANSLELVIGIEIEPYHAFGESKYDALGRHQPEILMQTDEQIDEIIDYISSKTNTPIKRA